MPVQHSVLPNIPEVKGPSTTSKAFLTAVLQKLTATHCTKPPGSPSARSEPGTNTNTNTAGRAPSSPRALLGRSHIADADPLSKLEQEERQLQEEIARLEKLERLKSEGDQVRWRILGLSHQQQQQQQQQSRGRVSTPLSFTQEIDGGELK
ncbi:MAG: hypothetical protein Q9173_000657 [Seirophora scorigena]